MVINLYSLFIDTHYKNIYLGLFYNTILIDSIVFDDVKSTSELIMDLINSILDKNGCKVQNLANIIVCNGPGSFTGVRIGVTIAKMLSYLLKIPIYSINSLELVALSENYKHSYYAVKENNGFYVGKFINGKLCDDIVYKKNLELNEIGNDICFEENLNIEKLLANFNNLHKENCFDISPIYVKNIAALNSNIENKG